MANDNERERYESNRERYSNGRNSEYEQRRSGRAGDYDDFTQGYNPGRYGRGMDESESSRGGQGYGGGYGRNQEEWQGGQNYRASQNYGNQGYGRGANEWEANQDYRGGQGYGNQGYGNQGYSNQGYGRGLNEWEANQGYRGSQNYGGQGQGYGRGREDWERNFGGGYDRGITNQESSRRTPNQGYYRQDYSDQGYSGGQSYGRTSDQWDRSRGQGYGNQDYGNQSYDRRINEWEGSYGGGGNSGMNQWGGSQGSRNNQGYSGQDFGGSQGRFAGVGPKGYQRSDDRIKEELSDHLTWHGDVDASNLEVKVNNGMVTLSGTVDDRWTKRAAEDIAASIQGVQDVHNQIQVRRQDNSTQGEHQNSWSQTGSQSGSSQASTSSASNRKNAQTQQAGS